MISKEKAISIAKAQMPSEGYKVDNAVLDGNVFDDKLGWIHLPVKEDLE